MNGFNTSEPTRSSYILTSIRWRLLAASALAVAVALLLPVYLARADPPWETNERADDAPGATDANKPSIGVDSSGNAYAVWEDYRNGNADIYFSYRPAGGSWQTNVRVDDASGPKDAYKPSIAVDSAGNAYAVWEDHRSGNADIYFSYRPAGGSWQANVRVDDAPAPKNAYKPSIAVDSTGNAYAVWEDYRNGDADIYFSYRPAGGSWQTNEWVDDAPSTKVAYAPSIAVSSSGNAYAVWEDYRNDNGSIYFSYRPAGGSWQTNVRVDDTPGTTVVYVPSIAVDPSGNAYAVWYDYRNGNFDIYSSYRPAGGSWQANVRVDDAPGATVAYAPSIAVNSFGSAYTVWYDYRSGNADIYFSYRPAGGTWQANERVDDAPSTTDASYPSIAVNPSGNAYVVWEDYRSGNADIYYAWLSNTPPEAQNIYVTPGNPADNDTLTLHYDYYDADGDPEGATQIRWTRDDVLQPGLNNKESSPDIATLSGEQWCATVRPHDGKVYGATATFCVGIAGGLGNTPPQALNVTITPSAPTDDDDLTLTYVYTDTENDPQGSTQIRWYRNDMLQPSYNNQTTVSANDTYLGETWCAKVYPHDGTDYGPVAQSNCVIIGSVGNHLPQALNPAIVPAEPESSHNLGLTYVYTDADDDLEMDTQLRWYRDDVLQPAFNDLTFGPNVATLPGETWWGTVRPHDGKDYGLLVNTNLVLISGSSVNTPPEVHDVHITPAQPGDDDHLRLTYIYLDPDGDPEADTIILWFLVVNEILIPQDLYAGLTAIPSQATEIGQTWYATVVPHDGQDYGPSVASHSVTVQQTRGNNPPKALDVYVSPGQPGLNDNLEVHYIYQDPDGDPEGATQILWELNGTVQNSLNDLTVVPASYTSVGQEWCASVKPHDGGLYGEAEPVGGICVTIALTRGNVQPKVLTDTVYIAPSSPRSDQNVRLHYTYFDQDGHSEGDTQIRWFRNGLQLGLFNDLTVIPAASTNPGDNWSAAVVPHDGFAYGELVSTQVVTVNRQSQVQNVQVLPLQPESGEVLSLTYQYYDADGDPDSSQIRWYRNGQLQSAYDNSRVLPASATSAGEQWFASVVPYDGIEYGQVVKSNVVTIVGTDKTLSVYLPVMLGGASDPPVTPTPTPPPNVCRPDSYYEENDRLSHACKLIPGQVYNAYPDDEDDLYYVFFDQTSSLSVRVDNYSASIDGQLLVYDGNVKLIDREEWLQGTGEVLPNKDYPYGTRNLPPGKYYVRVYTYPGSFNTNKLYQLVVTISH